MSFHSPVPAQRAEARAVGCTKLNAKGKGGKDMWLIHLRGKEVAVVTCSM